MADNVKKYTDGNVAWDADYNNVVLVDPNKIFDKDGRMQERLVDHENLVMYANLEARIIPRTKLALGENFDENSNLLSPIANFGGSPLGKINFLSPQGKKYLDTSWSDQITGRGALEGQGINQTQVSQNNSRSVGNIEDTQLLGITNIKITNNASFIPVVTVDMVDVQGRTLFELGEKSPYSAFMQLPYPIFYLTVKGYYGKAIRYELMLKSFNARFDPGDGNYKITLEMIGRTAAILSDLPLGSLYALPHMYNSTLSIPNSTDGLANGDQEQLLIDSANNLTDPFELIALANTGVNQTQPMSQIITTRGMKKIREVYNYYESKGLIGPNFPRLTIAQMKMKLDKLEEYITNSFAKEDVSVLNDIDEYRKVINDYRDRVYSQNTQSWYQKYMDGKNVLVDNTTGEIYYTFKKDLNLQAKKDAIVELTDSIVKFYNNKLSNNATFGDNGKYTINGKTYSSSLTFTMNYNDFPFYITSEDLQEKINLEQSYILTNNKAPNEVELSAYTLTLITDIKAKGFKYDFQTQEIVTDEQIIYFGFGTKYNNAKFSVNSFLEKISDLEERFGVLEEKIENQLSDALMEKIESSENGLGFKPTIRNILAVIMASADAFYRLMDDVHTEAWKLKSDPVRASAILNPEQSTNVDNKFVVNGQVIGSEELTEINFVYPWPQYIEQEKDEKDNVYQVVKYPGLSSSINRTKGYLYDKWPEIEFLEEYVTGQLLKQALPTPSTMPNQKKEANFIPSNAIEFPYTVQPYGDKSEVPFFYEIWERTYLNTYYSKLFRDEQSRYDLYSVLGDFESYTIKEAISSDPELMMILKRYGLSFQTFEPFLKSISNEGTGQNWNNYIRDIFNTDYINADIDNDSYIYSLDTINVESITVQDSQESQNKLVEYLKSTQSNTLDYTDVYPFTDLNWLKNNMAYGNSVGNVRDSNDTTKSLYYFDNKKTICSFNPSDLTSVTKDVPLTNISWINNLPTAPSQTKNVSTNLMMKAYYDNRLVTNLNYFITESVINYGPNYQGNVSETQTTSLLNTPYFINSIIEGVDNYKNGNPYPYKNLAYLFLNSLPLSTLKEKSLFVTDDNGLSQQSLKSYLSAIFNKTSAIHKLPYAWILKYGSIWHRYKNYIENGVDHLDTVWKSFDQNDAYDPTNQQPITSYNIKKYDGSNYLYEMQNTLAGVSQNMSINIGLYPKLINSIYYMFTDTDIITDYTPSGWDSAYNNGLRIGFTNDSTVMVPSNQFATPTTQNLSIKNWYQYIEDTTGLYDNNINQPRIFVIPSTGGLSFSQYRFENTNGITNIFQKTPTQVLSDQTLYDGSARSLWGGSNFGFYNNSLVKKPSYNEYLKVIDTENEYQDPFTITYNSDYSNIEELLSVFPKQLLDIFENEFLNFTKSPDNTIELLAGENTNLSYFDLTDLQDIYNRNIISVLRPLFISDMPKSNNENGIAYEISDNQMTNFVYGMEQFLGYQVILKRGNPGNFDRRVFNSLSTNDTFKPVDPINFGKYVTNSLPSSGGGTTLLQSQAAYPDAWKALKLNVGEFTNSDLSYKDSGSYITDFFITMNIEFTKTNVEQLSQVIKIFATQKLQNPSLTSATFTTNLNQYLSNQNKYQSNILNNVFRYLNKNIPNITQIKESKRSAMDGDIAKTELWEVFKVLNDKWIAGGDFKNRVLFEDFLFLDRANRDIGDSIIVDVNHLSSWLSNERETASLYSLIGEILAHNNFIFMALPAYVNFYGVQEITKNGVPQDIDIPNSSFGTYLEVDYQKNKPKFVCMYTNRLSEHTEQKENIDYRFANDSFDLRKSSENPLVENQNNKQDWGTSNKVVAFNVDFGIRNQNIFKSISLNQSQYKNTSETFKVLTDMANQTKGQKTYQQSTSLFNIYKTRSYTCEVQSMGNVMIQPTMYFNLRYVPMFTGPYWILNVTHTITPNDFQTDFSGVRISKFSFPNLDKLTMSVNLDLLRRYQKKVNNIVTTTSGQTSANANLESEASTTVTTNTNPPALPQGGVNKPTRAVLADCLNKTKYPNLPWIDNSSITTIGKKDVIEYLKTRTDIPLKIRRLVFGMAWTEQGQGTNFTCVGNDLFGIHTDGTWSNNMIGFVSGQSCVKVIEGGSRPLAVFDNFDNSIKFVLSRFNTAGFVQRQNQYQSYYGEAESYARLWKSCWNLGVGLYGGNDVEQKIDKAISDANKSGGVVNNKNYWQRTVASFQSALNYSVSNGL